MKVLHIVPEINEANGVYQVARDLAQESGGEVVDARKFGVSGLKFDIGTIDEVWVHGMWLPRIWKACKKVLKLQTSNLKPQTSNVKPSLVRMTHGSLSPIYLERQGKWKKRLVGPIERWLLRRSDQIVATCEAEREWIRAYVGKGCPEIVVEDLKRFFELGGGEGLGRRSRSTVEDSLHVLYLGRRHPLKGVEFLERAVGEIGLGQRSRSTMEGVELRIVSDHFGEELERDWEWCDVLCLPTLSENFGRVVAEALARGKRVITTDGAPAWAPSGERSRSEGLGLQWWDRITYLKGYRDGTDEDRVRLLKEALEKVSG